MEGRVCCLVVIEGALRRLLGMVGAEAEEEDEAEGGGGLRLRVNTGTEREAGQRVGILGRGLYMEYNEISHRQCACVCVPMRGRMRVDREWTRDKNSQNFSHVKGLTAHDSRVKLKGLSVSN